jgi:hypothetical protein
MGEKRKSLCSTVHLSYIGPAKKQEQDIDALGTGQKMIAQKIQESKKTRESRRSARAFIAPPILTLGQPKNSLQAKTDCPCKPKRYLKVVLLVKHILSLLEKNFSPQQKKPRGRLLTPASAH